MNDLEPRFNWSAENPVRLDFGRGWLFGSAKKPLVNILPALRLQLGGVLLVHSEGALRWSRLPHARGILIVVFASGVSFGINASFIL